jgi:hypothetical protein
VIKRSATLLAIYLAGIAIVGGWSLSHVLGGTVTRENGAGVIVFPLAWAFGFWPTVMPMLLAARVWRLQSLLEQYVARRAAGVSTEAPEQELEDTVTVLVAHENGIPERLARWLVRRFLNAMRARAAAG